MHDPQLSAEGIDSLLHEAQLTGWFADDLAWTTQALKRFRTYSANEE